MDHALDTSWDSLRRLVPDLCIHVIRAGGGPLVPDYYAAAVAGGSVHVVQVEHAAAAAGKY